MYIYLDESGDLGFDWSKAKTSTCFVITLLICHDQKARNAFVYAIRRTLKKLNHKKKKFLAKELKGTETKLTLKKYFLRQMSSLEGWSLYSVIVDKKKLTLKLDQRKFVKHDFYNTLAESIVKKIKIPLHTSEITFIVDRCKNSKDIQKFNLAITLALSSLITKRIRLFIRHEASHENPCLQAVDLFCWGILRKQQYQDSEWYREFSDRILYEEVY